MSIAILYILYTRLPARATRAQNPFTSNLYRPLLTPLKTPSLLFALTSWSPSLFFARPSLSPTHLPHVCTQANQQPQQPHTQSRSHPSTHRATVVARLYSATDRHIVAIRSVAGPSRSLNQQTIVLGRVY